MVADPCLIWFTTEEAMGKKNFYAVRTGRKPGIYKTWAQCQQQVTGFAGAVFKGFETEDDAIRFLSGGPALQPDKKEKALTSPPEEICASLQPGEAIAFTDGSFDSSKPDEFSCGYVIFTCQGVVRGGQHYKDSEWARMNNVAGEIKGAQAVMDFCEKQKIHRLTLYHDYMGIAAWCDGSWEAKQPATQAYKKRVLSLKPSLAISFCHVKGHSGNRYNEEVDQLAKQALSGPIGDLVQDA